MISRLESHKKERPAPWYGLLRAILVLMVALLAASPALAAGFIVLDGQFNDWGGQANVGDPRGDAQDGQTDLQTFYFATNPNDDTAYFMAERWEGGSQSIVLRLRVDTNNNGAYDEPDDRIIEVRYSPNPYGSADVDLYSGTGVYMRRVASNAPWGESGKGRRVEWGVSFADLGIAPFQTIRVQLFSMQGSQVSDGMVDVQWSPANALGKPLLAALALGGAAWLFYRQRKITWPRRS